MEKDGVLYVNDSKGTNPDSTFQAIYAYDRPMILLLGGRNKGIDFTELMQLVKLMYIQLLVLTMLLFQLLVENHQLFMIIMMLLIKY